MELKVDSTSTSSRELAGPGLENPLGLETMPAVERLDEPARPAQDEESKPRYVFIDGLRGIAALLVSGVPLRHGTGCNSRGIPASDSDVRSLPHQKWLVRG